jgi:succinate-semialdehyde dehydrogenase/glutarate-semialdehyde dehydrogenase
LSQEQGKPIVESYTMELIPSVDGLRWIADEGQRLLADEKIPMRSALFASKSAKFAFEPVGVIGVIAPWNYPWSIPLTEVAIALMAGNGVVLKPASLTPLIGEEVRRVFERAGLPQGLVRTVHGGGRIGDALVKSRAEKIFFTGSVEVGRKVGMEAAKRLKGAVLELGGKDPMIVCSDADLNHTIPGAIWGAFANGGQTCAGIERAYVVESVADRFIEGVVSRAQAMRVGNPMLWDTEIGPMTSESQADLVEELIADAVARGAEMRCGGAREVAGLSGRFIAPTVLTGVTHEMRIMKEEIFGPVLPIIRVADEAEALRLANDSEFGLGASVWTRDREKGERIARQLEAGMTWINDHAFTHGACQCAWSGVKDSGVGISHSKFGFYECVNVKTITYEPGLTRDFWWHPYDETLGKAVRASGKIFYGSPTERRSALRSGLGSLIEVGRRTLRG